MNRNGGQLGFVDSQQEDFYNTAGGRWAIKAGRKQGTTRAGINIVPFFQQFYQTLIVLNPYF